MNYAEHGVPESLAGLIAGIWTAAVPPGEGWVVQDAVPDGCVELIRRRSGRSLWRSEQPALFAAGIALKPVRLELSAGSSFVAVKFFPWAWNALGAPRCAEFVDRWVGVEAASELAALMNGEPEAIADSLVDALRGIGLPPYAAAVLEEQTVAAVAARSGIGTRQLQRIFRREYGIGPRAYLRLLRFRDAMREFPGGDTLAGIAAAQGYADQAHMAREFRSLAGRHPTEVRERARGPFVP